MTSSVYITDIAGFLPNEPVSNDDIENVLGMVGDRPSRSRKLILRNNGIKNRYYAIDPKTGGYTHNNAQLAAEAVRALAKKANFDLNELKCLCAGSSSPDLVQPSHAAMVHGELASPPCEIFSAAGVCTSSVMAMKYAMMAVAMGNCENAVALGSEFPSRYMRGRNFEPEIDARIEALEKRPELGFEKDFLRWMLSDGAGAALLKPEPNADGLSLRIDWIDCLSFANTMPVCMYCGGNKDDDHSMHYWHEVEDPLDIIREGYYALKQDARVLNDSIMPISVRDALVPMAAKHKLKPEDVTWFLPHYSSKYFRAKLKEQMVEHNFDIPDERWYTNLTEVGNVGSASIYLMLEGLMYSGKLKKGDRLLCYIPESARFSICYMQLTVV